MKPSKTEIKIEAIRQGISFTKIAKELGIPRSRVSMVISGQTKSQRVLDYILTRLGFTAKEKEAK